MPGWADSAAACSPWTIKDDNNLWHMYYLGTSNTMGGGNKIPIARTTDLNGERRLDPTPALPVT
jgi:hypothetical protein